LGVHGNGYMDHFFIKGGGKVPERINWTYRET